MTDQAVPPAHAFAFDAWFDVRMRGQVVPDWYRDDLRSAFDAGSAQGAAKFGEKLQKILISNVVYPETTATLIYDLMYEALGREKHEQPQEDQQTEACRGSSTERSAGSASPLREGSGG